MAGFLPSEIPIRGDQSLPWFDPNWPWYLERLSRFALNSIFTYDPIDIDFSKVSAVAMWAGRREIHWEHCEPQQILVKHENTWLILMRHITEMELLRYFDNDIEQVNSIGQYGWPSQRYVSVGMQGEKSEFVRASNRQNDKGEYECEVVVFNSRDETTQAERVSQGIKTMIDGAENTVWRFFNGDYSVAIAAEILANWGFVQSEHWPTIVSRFPEFAEASEYLIYLNVLYPDGSHPLHNRPSIKFPQTASNVTNTDGEDDEGIPRLALQAVIDGGDAGLINQAIKVPAAERYSVTMMNMLAEDRKYYEWGLNDWATHLKAAKKTIQSTDAWRHIMAYREQEKQNRSKE